MIKLKKQGKNTNPRRRPYLALRKRALFSVWRLRWTQRFRSPYSFHISAPKNLNSELLVKKKKKKNLSYKEHLIVCRKHWGAHKSHSHWKVHLIPLSCLSCGLADWSNDFPLTSLATLPIIPPPCNLLHERRRHRLTKLSLKQKKEAQRIIFFKNVGGDQLRHTDFFLKKNTKQHLVVI